MPSSTVLRREAAPAASQGSAGKSTQAGPHRLPLAEPPLCAPSQTPPRAPSRPWELRQEAASSAGRAAPWRWGWHKDGDRDSGCPATEVVPVAVPQCHTFCWGGAAEPALSVAALVPAGAAGVVGAEGGLQAQAACEVPRAPPRLLRLPCGGTMASEQCWEAELQPPGSRTWVPAEGDRGPERDCSPGVQGPGRTWPMATPGAARQGLGCGQRCCHGRRGTGWSGAGVSPCDTAPGLPYPHTETCTAQHGTARGCVCPCKAASATRSIVGPAREKPTLSQHRLEVRIHP